jgi:hypothetical protein
MKVLNNRVFLFPDEKIAVLYKLQILYQSEELSWIGFYLINLE